MDTMSTLLSTLPEPIFKQTHVAKVRTFRLKCIILSTPKREGLSPPETNPLFSQNCYSQFVYYCHMPSMYLRPDFPEFLLPPMLLETRPAICRPISARPERHLTRTSAVCTNNIVHCSRLSWICWSVGPPRFFFISRQLIVRIQFTVLHHRKRITKVSSTVSGKPMMRSRASIIPTDRIAYSTAHYGILAEHGNQLHQAFIPAGLQQRSGNLLMVISSRFLLNLIAAVIDTPNIN